MRPFFAAFFFLLWTTGAAAAEASSHWLEVKSEHFTVMTDSNERQARHVASQLERMHDVFSRLLPAAENDPGSSIVVLAFRNRKGFQSVEPAAYLQKKSLELAGLFMSGQDRSYILLRLDTAEDHPYSTVYHEYTHYMLRHEANLPIWLNEGFAQFYENTDILDDRVDLGQPSPRALRFLRQQPLLPLSTLFRVDGNSPFYHDEEKGNIFYAESWALTHFLSLQDFGTKQNRLRSYMRYVARGEGAVVAAQHAFGDLQRLQSQLQAYIRSSDYHMLALSLQNGARQSSLSAVSLPQAEVDAMRADVLTQNGRSQEAETLIGTVLRESPGSAQAHESMGMLKLRQGDTQGARKWFGQAVALQPPSFLSCFYYGELSMGNVTVGDIAADAKIANSYLHQALALNPRFAPALAALARLDAAQHQHLDEALQMATRAVQSDPLNVDYRLTAAEVRLARKELSTGVSVLQAAAQIARTPDERQRVQSRLTQVLQYQAAVRRIAAFESGAAPTNPGQTKVSSAIPAGATQQLAAPVQDSHKPASHPARLVSPDHNFPTAAADGPTHTVTGTLRHVGCFTPQGLLLQVGDAAKPLTLYSNDMYSISFTAANFDPKGELNPCDEFEGLKATVSYTSVDDPTVAGQILTMELSR